MEKCQLWSRVGLLPAIGTDFQRGCAVYCTTCNVDSANSLFCHVCDSYLPTERVGTKANLASRGIALLVDFVFYALLILSAIWIFRVLGYSIDAEKEAPLKLLLWLAAYLVLSLWPLSRGKTPGKFLMRIRVVDKRNGRMPGLGRMLVRETIGKIISGAFLSLGYFWAIWDKDSQAWHDKIAGTVVLHPSAESDRYPLTFKEKVALVTAVFGICICAALLQFDTRSQTFSSSGGRQLRPAADSIASLPSVDGGIENDVDSGKSPERKLLPKWSAGSHTAAAVTGDIEMLADGLRVAGNDLHLQVVRDLEGQDEVNAKELFMLGTAATAPITLYKTSISSETKFLNGSDLCGKDDTTWIVITTDRDGGTLYMAMFSGSSEPDLNLQTSKNLCGTYSYMREQ
jgi:uncharacterized RDD family membrane protein YckC